MRGIIFTEFTTFAEEAFGMVAVQDALDRCDLASGGGYTAVGNYPYAELEAILTALLAAHPDVDAEKALYDFGFWLAGRFKTLYASFFAPHDNAMSFLDSIDGHIHTEVRKLHPDAVPPQVLLARETDGRYHLTYQSHRPLAAVAIGLTAGSLAAFGGDWTITASETTEGGRAMTLIMTRDKAT